MHTVREKGFHMIVNKLRCRCTGKNGKLKKLYPNYSSAMENLYYAKESRNVTLHVYECPEHLGFHLTSNLIQY